MFQAGSRDFRPGIQADKPTPIRPSSNTLEVQAISALGRGFKGIDQVSRQRIPALLLSNRHPSLMPLWHKQVTLF